MSSLVQKEESNILWYLLLTLSMLMFYFQVSNFIGVYFVTEQVCQPRCDSRWGISHQIFWRVLTLGWQYVMLDCAAI